MPKHKPPVLEVEQQHASLAVRDVQKAVKFYCDKLGFTKSFTWGKPVTMAGVMLGHQQIFLRKGVPNPKGIEVYFVVDNADELYEYHRDGGVEVDEPIADRDYGMRDYAVRDLHGYRLGFGRHAFDADDPIPIERVDVTLRLEKRLAALLHDLAEYKHMSLSSAVEEILLHTNEPLGDGVASPHTRAQLARIQELKRKHGIDYDVHGSYRFVEQSKSKT